MPMPSSPGGKHFFQKVWGLLHPVDPRQAHIVGNPRLPFALEYVGCFPLLVLKGIDHYWKYVYLTKWKSLLCSFCFLKGGKPLVT